MAKILLLMGKIINNLFGYSKGKHKYFSAWKYLHTIAFQGMGRVQGNAVEISGEKIVLKKIISAAGQKAVILDIGANKGQYSSLACSQFVPDKSFEMHLFEPSSFNINTLQKKFTSDNYTNCHFIINQMALSDENGFAFLFSDSEGSDLSSLMDLKTPIRKFDESKKEKVQTMTLDEYTSRNNIRSIDLLKIDVEGAEYKVLTGAKKILENKTVKNIQFEFGAGNITSRIFFYDFWDLLSAQYSFYQVLSDGLVPVNKYSIDMEIFKTTNYFLTLKN